MGTGRHEKVLVGEAPHGSAPDLHKLLYWNLIPALNLVEFIKYYLTRRFYSFIQMN